MTARTSAFATPFHFRSFRASFSASLRTLGALGSIGLLTTSSVIACGGSPAPSVEANEAQVATRKPSPEISLSDAITGLVKAHGQAKVETALDQLIVAKFPNPVVAAPIRAQIHQLVSDPQRAAKFPTVPFAALRLAPAILDRTGGPDTPLPSAVTFDLHDLKADCHPTRTRLTPIAADLPELQTGWLTDQSIDDCTLARAENFAAVLNNLALENGSKVVSGGETYTDIARVINALIRGGHTIQVEVKSYNANFTDIFYNGVSVAAPVWIDTGIKTHEKVSGTLLLPAAHAGYTMRVAGPQLNAEVEFFFGLKGGVAFRAQTSIPRARWEGGHVLSSYDSRTHAQKVVDTFHFAGQLRKKWTLAGASLPDGGYGSLGVCLDSVAVVQTLVGEHSALFPLTRAASHASSDLIDRALSRIPNDALGFDPNTVLPRIQATLAFDKMSEVRSEFPALAADLASLGVH
ncbi:MAG: hypothetical protein NVS3B20_07550 [Polyangiales bacterium]